jgi:hypothetical protein
MTDTPIQEPGQGGVVQKEAATVDAAGNKVQHVMLTDSAGVSIAMRGVLADHSGAIASGGTAQTVPSAANLIFFQNVSDTDMFIDFGVTAQSAGGTSIYAPAKATVAGSAAPPPLVFSAPGFVPAGTISIMCATSGKKYVLKTA